MAKEVVNEAFESGL